VLEDDRIDEEQRKKQEAAELAARQATESAEKEAADRAAQEAAARQAQERPAPIVAPPPQETRQPRRRQEQQRERTPHDEEFTEEVFIPNLQYLGTTLLNDIVKQEEALLLMSTVSKIFTVRDPRNQETAFLKELNHEDFVDEALNKFGMF